MKLTRSARSFPIWAMLCLFVFTIFQPLPIQAYNVGGKSDCEEGVKNSEFGVYCGYSEPKYKGYKYDSKYLPMRDSTLIAIDIFLPKKMKEGETFPTLLYQTRYIRSLKAKWPFNWIINPVLAVIPDEEIEYFTSHGYACVIVDVRGSGASTGSRTMEFSPEEVKDGAEIVDWIIQQPWSDKQVASTGVSYFGTTAELLLVNQHPNVKLSIPRSNIFDLYNHILFPGGVRQGPFVDVWGYTTRSLDENNLAPFGKQAKNLIKGAQPVKGDKGRKIYRRAMEEHEANFDVFDGIQQIDYRDESVEGMVRSSNDYSIHNNLDKIVNSGADIFRIGGWYDGALKKSVIEGFWNTPNTDRVILGPWDHGPANNASPYSGHTDLTFDVFGEMLKYLDFHLKNVPNGMDADKPFHYFTVGEEKWKSTDVWPPANVVNTDLYFSTDHTLSNNAQLVKTGSVEYDIDYTCTTGENSRWNSMTGLYKNGPTNYNNWSKQSDKLLSFATEPFTHPVEITGHPIVELYLSADAKDATVFVFLEDVGPDSTVRLITEGQFRAIHRKEADPGDYKYSGPYHTFNEEDAMPLVPGEVAKLGFDLLPISYQIPAGHYLRVSISGADCEHFDLVKDPPTKFSLSAESGTMSKITLPVVPPTDLGM